MAIEGREGQSKINSEFGSLVSYSALVEMLVGRREASDSLGQLVHVVGVADEHRVLGLHHGQPLLVLLDIRQHGGLRGQRCLVREDLQVTTVTYMLRSRAEW